MQQSNQKFVRKYYCKHRLELSGCVMVEHYFLKIQKSLFTEEQENIETLVTVLWEFFSP